MADTGVARRVPIRVLLASAEAGRPGMTRRSGAHAASIRRARTTSCMPPLTPATQDPPTLRSNRDRRPLGIASDQSAAPMLCPIGSPALMRRGTGRCGIASASLSSRAARRRQAGGEVKWAANSRLISTGRQ